MRRAFDQKRDKIDHCLALTRRGVHFPGEGPPDRSGALTRKCPARLVLNFDQVSGGRGDRGNHPCASLMMTWHIPEYTIIGHGNKKGISISSSLPSPGVVN